MSRKSGRRFPACAKPVAKPAVWHDASGGEGRSEKDMRKRTSKAGGFRMRTVLAVALAAIFLAGCSSSVNRDRAAMMGVVAGAGAGAFAGAAITGTATGTGVGAAVGGVTGGVLASSLAPGPCYRWSRTHHRRVRVRCY